MPKAFSVGAISFHFGARFGTQNWHFFGNFLGHFLDHFLVTFWTTFGCHFGADGPGVIFTAGLGVIFTAGLGVISTAGLGVIFTAGLISDLIKPYKAIQGLVGPYNDLKAQ